MRPATPAIASQTTASTRNPSQTVSPKKRSLRSQAIACMSIARKSSRKTPAAMPTTPPLTSCETFSETSALASSISSRTRTEVFSEMSMTSSPTDLSSAGFGSVLGGVAMRGGLVGRVFVVDPLPDEHGHAVGGDVRDRADAGDEAAPDQFLDDVVVHLMPMRSSRTEREAEDSATSLCGESFTYPGIGVATRPACAPRARRRAW